MKKLILKIYPANQIQRYLLLDIVICVFFFYKVLTAQSPVGLFGTFLLLAVFLALFYLGLWYRDWRLMVSVLGGFGLMTVFAVYYDEWILLFAAIFADFLGRAPSMPRLAAGLCGLVGMYMATSAVLHQNALYFFHTPHLPFLLIQLAIPFVVRLMEKSRSLKDELASANERIAYYVQEEERHRLARDLHDTLGQTLTMIKVKSELALRTMDKNPERAKQEMQEVIRTSRTALKQVRDMVTNMKYVSLNEELELGQKLLSSSGIHFAVQKAGGRPNLTKVSETMLALALRESLTNIVKHSRAKHCVVTEQFSDGWYHLHIEDDGIGLGNEKTEGHGLTSIQERMRLVQGKAHVGPSPSGGVKVTLSLPVRPAAGEVTS